MRLRFAPSPTGLLHVGNARTALFNWLLARGGGGTFILRIEDTDVQRSTRESEAGILEDLRWMGLTWDEGPDVGGPHGPYRQSERLGLYASYARALIEQGAAYHCFCTTEQIEADRRAAMEAGRPPKYVGRCRDLPPDQASERVAAGESAVIRLRVPENRDVTFQDVVRGEVRFSTDVIGDPVLVRSDGNPAYNFTVVIDDALMAITHVIRGEDHISNTPRQVLLYEALGFQPPVFAHLALVLGPDHAPLSKRHGATSVAEFRARGYLPESLVNYLALLGWSPGGGDELLDIRELARRFALESVGHSAAVFDREKLAWVNRHYLRLASPGRLTDLALPSFRAAGYLLNDSPEARAFIESVVPMASDSVDRVDQMPERLRFLFVFDPAEALGRDDVGDVLREPGAREVIDQLARELADAGRLDREAFRAAAARVKQATGHKGKHLFHPIRVALTGEAGGPELDLAVPAIDRGAELSASCGLSPIVGCAERAAKLAEAMKGRPC
ncbi:MAG: glutamate--tRNA ligase [Acidobacteria bacterium]|nr:glutamate--tRNA ligase [Acidobacteriota bacterium]